MQSSLEVCKLHNRLSTALLQNESYLISHWHTTIEPARAALQLPLLVPDGNESEISGARHIKVNCKQWYI